MARKLRTKKGRAVYSRRKAIVEPVFGQIDTVQNGRRLLLRGKPAARAQWRLHCAVHNLLKLHRAGGLDVIREKTSTPTSASTAKRCSHTRLTDAIRSFAAPIRGSLGDPLPRSDWTAITDPGS
jgi:hypothetical protein